MAVVMWLGSRMKNREVGGSLRREWVEVLGAIGVGCGGSDQGVVRSRALPEFRPVMSLKGAPMIEKPSIELAE